ncbi:uncharacterized protein PF3D7_1120600 [Anabrus simplex]|uniref:uncharacterized protein PF3D7_1120600 n=1 Tax=Anabrus simplex TaxID=316456 RepID=UPI0035A2D270
MGWNSSWCTGLILVAVLGLTLGIEEVALQLNTKKWQHQVSEKFLSMSLDPAALLQGRDLRWSSARTLTLAKSLSPAYLRLAGTGSNYFLFQNKQDNNSISESDWVLLNNFCQITGVRLVAALNGMVRKDGVWDPRNCLTLIAFSDQMGFDLDWQLGYELQRVPVPGGGAQWGRDILALRHILDAFPRYAHSAVVAPDITYFRTKEDAEFLKTFFEIAGPALAAVTWHPNFAEPSVSTDSSSEDSEEADDLEAQPDTLSLDNEVLGRLLARITPRKPLWIAESHTESARGQDTFAGALQWAQRLGVAARLGIQVLFRQPDVRGIMQPSPDYWVSLLHKRLVGREVFDSRLVTGNRTHISVFCHCTRDKPGSITLFGANILHHRVRIAVKGSTLGLGDMMSMDQYTLTEYQGHTLLNGALLGLSPEEELPVLTPRIRHVPRSLTLSMPPQSIVYWVLPEARVRACEESQPQSASLLRIKGRKSNALQEDSSEESDEMGFFDKDASQSIEKYVGKSPLAKLNSIRERKNFVGIDLGNNKENNIKVKNNQNMNNENLLKLQLGSYDNLFYDQENNRTAKYSQDSLEANIAEAIRLLQRGVEKHSAALKTDRSKFYEDRMRDSSGEAWFSRDNNKREYGQNLKETSEPQDMGVEKSEAGKLTDVESNSNSSLKLQVKPLVKDEILIPNMKKAEKYLQSMFISLMEDDGVNSTEEVTEHPSDRTLERSKRSVLRLTTNKTPVMADPGWRRWRQRWNKKSRPPLTKSHEASEEDESDSFPEGDVYVSEIGGGDSHPSEYVYIDDDDEEDFMDHDDLNEDEDEFGYFADLEGTHFFNAEFFENMDFTPPVVDNQFDGDEELWEVDVFPSEMQKETFNTSDGNSNGGKTIHMHTFPSEEDLSRNMLSQGILKTHQQVVSDTRGRESEIKSKVRGSGRSRLNGGMNMLRYKQGEDMRSNVSSEKMMYFRNINNNNAQLHGNANGFEIRPGQDRIQMKPPSHNNNNNNNNVPHRWHNTYMQSSPLYSMTHLTYAQAGKNQENPTAQHYEALRNEEYLTLHSPKRVIREIPTDFTEQLNDTHNSTENHTEINRDIETAKYTSDNDTHQSDMGVSNSQLNTTEIETRTDLQESSRLDNQFSLRNEEPELHKMEADSASQESERTARATMERESLKEPDNTSALAEGSRTVTSNLLEDLVKDKVTLNDLLPQNIKKQIKIMEEKGEASDLKIVDNGNQTQDIKYIPADDDNDDPKEENSTKQEQLEPESTTCALDEVEEARVPDQKTARRLALQRKREQRLESLKSLFRSRKRKRDLNRNRNHYITKGRDIPAYDYLGLLWPSNLEKVRLVDDDRFPTQGNGNNFQHVESVPKQEYLPSVLTLKYRTEPSSDILPVKTYLGEMLAEPDSNIIYPNIIYKEKQSGYQGDNHKVLSEPSENESSVLGVTTYKYDSPQIKSLFHELQHLEEDGNVDDDYISYLADYVSELKLLKELFQRSENPSSSKVYDQMFQHDTSSIEREKAPEMDEYRTAQINILFKKVPNNVLRKIIPQNSKKPLQDSEGIENILKLVKYHNNHEYQDRGYDEYHPLSSFKEETDTITNDSIQSQLHKYNNQVSSTNSSHHNLKVTTEKIEDNKNDATGFRPKRSVELINTEANSEETDSKSNLSDYRQLNDKNILNELAYKFFPLSQEKKKQVKMPQKGGNLSQSAILLGDHYSSIQISSDEVSDENISEDENVIPDEGHEKERLIKFYNRKNVIPFNRKQGIQNDGEIHSIEQQKHITHKKGFVNVENQKTIKSTENETYVQSDHNIESNESVAVTDRAEGIMESKGTSDNQTLLNDKSDLENKIEITLNKNEKASDHIQIVNKKNSNREGNGGFFQTVLGKLKSVLGVIRSFASSAFSGN